MHSFGEGKKKPPQEHQHPRSYLHTLCGLFVHSQSDKDGYIGTSNELIGLRIHVLIMREQKPVILKDM